MQLRDIKILNQNSQTKQQIKIFLRPSNRNSGFEKKNPIEIKKREKRYNYGQGYQIELKAGPEIYYD